jgi:hypothetical protein
MHKAHLKAAKMKFGAKSSGFGKPRRFLILDKTFLGEYMVSERKLFA